MCLTTTIQVAFDTKSSFVVTLGVPRASTQSVSVRSQYIGKPSAVKENRGKWGLQANWRNCPKPRSPRLEELTTGGLAVRPVQFDGCDRRRPLLIKQASRGSLQPRLASKSLGPIPKP